MPITHINSDLARQQTTTTGTGTLSVKIFYIVP